MLAKYIVEKLAMVKDYVIVQINSPWGGTRTQTGEYGKWMLISCERPLQCLCCDRI